MHAPSRTNPQSRVVLDPYAAAVLSRRRWGQMGPNLPYGDSGVLGLMSTWPQAAAALPTGSRSRGAPSFDWEGDRPLNLPMESLVIYEAHVRGFTAHQSSGVKAPGGGGGYSKAAGGRRCCTLYGGVGKGGCKANRPRSAHHPYDTH
jgi:isoamylase